MKQAQGELKESLLRGIREAIGGRRRFAVFSHEEPDGDAIGSQVAFSLALRALGKQVIAPRLDGEQPALEFLNRDGALSRYRPGEDERVIGEAEAIVVLDSCDYFRLGDMADAVKRSRALKINIDHHRDNSFFGDINYVRYEAGGAAELVYEVVKALGVPIRGAIADALYVGICTDTVGFKYVDPEGNMLLVLAELVRSGIDTDALQEKLYYLRPYTWLDDMAALIRRVAYEDGGAIAWFSIPGSRFLTYSQRDLASETLHQLLSMKRVQAVAMLHEERSGIEVWLRSKAGVDVGSAAKRLGGGGHRTAAGALVKGMGFGDAARRVVEEIRAAVRGSASPPAAPSL
jgi:bifunctional oligoribonuclease and PAP phosphatase NrnA